MPKYMGIFSEHPVYFGLRTLIQLKEFCCFNGLTHFVNKNAHIINLFKNFSLFANISIKLYPKLKNCFTFAATSYAHNAM